MSVTTNKLYFRRHLETEYTFHGCFGREILAFNRAWELINADETIVAVKLLTADGEIKIYDVAVVVK